MTRTREVLEEMLPAVKSLGELETKLKKSWDYGDYFLININRVLDYHIQVQGTRN